MAARRLTQASEYAALVERYDNFLFDCDGVIWEGDRVYDGVRETLAHLRRLGKRIFFVTNNATKSRTQNKQKFDKLEIEAQEDDIFSSAYASAAYLKYKLNFPADKRVYIIGEAGMEHELDSVGIAHCGGTSPEDNVLPDLMDFSGIDADPSVGCVMVGLDMHFNYKKVARAFRYLRENEGCLFVCTNLDSTFPTHGSVYPGAGAVAAPLMCCSGREPIVVGKPEAPMLESIMAKYNLDKGRTLMVGDRLDTDIKFGVNGGIDTLMTLTGVHQVADFDKPDPVAVPSYVIASLGDMSTLAS